MPKPPIALAGSHHKQNAALQHCHAAPGKIDIRDFKRSRVYLPLSNGPLVSTLGRPHRYLMARTSRATRVSSCETWREVFVNRAPHIILSVLSDKDSVESGEVPRTNSDYVLLPKIRSERALRRGFGKALSANCSIRSHLHHSVNR